MDRASDVARLEVRSRQLISQGGHERSEFTVYCPFRQRSMEVEQCEECSAFAGSDGGPGEKSKQVGCHRLAPAVDMPDAGEMHARASLQRTPVSRLMTRHVICVRPDLPLRELPRILATHRVGGTPVVDEQFRPIGMVTRNDLVREGFALGANRGEEIVIPRTSRFSGGSGCASDAMSQRVISVGERDSLLDAARLIGTRGVHRVVVTSRDGRVVGIVSSGDVLRWLSRQFPKGEGVAVVLETD
jgi:CBS domain-containing protein